MQHIYIQILIRRLQCAGITFSIDVHTGKIVDFTTQISTLLVQEFQKVIQFAAIFYEDDAHMEIHATSLIQIL